jgi:uncharacterized OB-fold protein
VKSALTAPHWESGATGTLDVQRCLRCREWSFPPSPRCRRCWSDELGFEPVAGTGELLTWTRNYQAWQSEPAPPYVVGLVRLHEGIRLLLNIVDAHEQVLSKGAPIMLSFEYIGDDVWLPQARLVRENR